MMGILFVLGCIEVGVERIGIVMMNDIGVDVVLFYYYNIQ